MSITSFRSTRLDSAPNSTQIHLQLCKLIGEEFFAFLHLSAVTFNQGQGHLD